MNWSFSTQYYRIGLFVNLLPKLFSTSFFNKIETQKNVHSHSYSHSFTLNWFDFFFSILSLSSNFIEKIDRRRRCWCWIFFNNFFHLYHKPNNLSLLHWNSNLRLCVCVFFYLSFKCSYTYIYINTDHRMKLLLWS